MLLWFVGLSALAVWFVFRDPRFDLRVLTFGALAPDLIDLPLGRVTFMHSLMTAVTALIGVMLMTRGDRRLRRRWLAFPIGLMLHLVLDGVVGNTAVFWWPFTGWTLGSEPVPTVARGWWNLPLELVGAGALGWLWWRGGWKYADRRRHLLRTGEFVAEPSNRTPPTC